VTRPAPLIRPPNGSWGGRSRGYGCPLLVPVVADPPEGDSSDGSLAVGTSARRSPGLSDGRLWPPGSGVSSGPVSSRSVMLVRFPLRAAGNPLGVGRERDVRLKPVDEQVVLMGASSGIGREAARRFAARGARVVVSARSADALETLVEEVRREGGTATAIPADTADVDAVRAVADGAVAEHGRLDTGIHLAGVGLWATFEDTTDQPGTVADMLLHAAEHGGRDLYAGGAARFLALQQRMSPRLLDAALSTRFARRALMTSEPKSETAPDNLLSPVAGRDRARSGFRAREHSLSNRLARRIAR
jgi:hypothetical protein